MTLYTATITLILVMDPLGNIPVFLSLLNAVEAPRRSRIVLRESFFAFLILSIFLFGGVGILRDLNITQSSISIAGGIVLFIIAIEMIFPKSDPGQSKERQMGEPFIVPLAIPMIAGPSSLATILIFASHGKDTLNYFTALAIAASVTTFVLFFATYFRKFLGQKGLIAMERLMGLILTTVAVQMFLGGIQQFFHLNVTS
jgi:multiple antibiotic resistance protein